MIITTRLTMDLQQPGYPPIVNAVQSDQYSRAVCLALYSGGAAWSVPAGATVAVRYTTPAGTRGYYDTMPDGSKAWAVTGNEITVYIAPQMLTAPGLVPAQVEIISGSSVLGTFPFHLRVSADLAEQIKTEEDYVNWLAWMESKLEQALVDAKESGAFTGPPPTLVSKSVTYQAGSSGTTPPTGSWSSSVPTVAQGQYLWTRTILTFDTGSVTTYQVGYMGVDATVKSEAVTYQVGDSGTTAPTGAWQSTVPAVAQGKYLWTRVVRQFNSGSSITSYSVAYMGKDGVSAATESTVTYQVGDSGTTPPTGTWQSTIPATPQGKYLWTRTVTTSNVAEPVTTYSVAHQGLDGAGSVSSVAGKSPDTGGNVALAPGDVGAVSKTGDTMRGGLSVANSGGTVGLSLSTDNEGGNIRIFPPDGNAAGVTRWEIDAFDGNMRIFAVKADGSGYASPIVLGGAGGISLGKALPISSGGTGATDAEAAQQTLGVYAYGVDFVASSVDDYISQVQNYASTLGHDNGITSFRAGWKDSAFGSAILINVENRRFQVLMLMQSSPDINFRVYWNAEERGWVQSTVT